jgi:hypothetical protein
MAVAEICVKALKRRHASGREVYLTFQILGKGGDPNELRIMVRDGGIGFAHG